METQHDFIGEMVLAQFVVGIDVDKQSFTDFGQAESDIGECLN